MSSRYSDLEIDLQEAYHLSEELRNEIRRLYELRRETIASLYAIIEELHKHHFNVNVTKAVGRSVGIVGGVVSTVGLALIPVTLGGSLVLTMIGSGTAALGGLTTTGAGIAETIISKCKKCEAQRAIEADSKKVMEVKQCWQRFERMSQKIMDEIEEACKSEEEGTRVNVAKRLKKAWCAFSERNGVQASMFLWSIFSFGKTAVRFVSSIWDVIQVIYLGLEEFAGKQGWIAQLPTKCVGRCGLIAFDGLFLCIGLVLDIGTLIYTLYDMCHGSKSKVALKLQEIVQKLEAEQEKWAQLFFQDGHYVTQ